MHPPPISIDGTSSYELDYWKGMSQKKNAFSKKGTDLGVIQDVHRLAGKIGKPKKDHSQLLQVTIDTNNSLFGDNTRLPMNQSLLRQRSISSMMKHSRMDTASNPSNAFRGASREPDSRQLSPRSIRGLSPINREIKASSVLMNYSSEGA